MNLKRFLNPKGIAIIGASKNKQKIGYQILNNLVSNGYLGDIYPINFTYCTKNYFFSNF